MRSLFVSLLTLMLLPARLPASCGLTMCPGPDLDSPSPKSWRFESVLHQTRFDIEGISGRYTQLTVRADYRPRAAWTAGAYLPMIRAAFQSEEHMGLGNPVLYAEGPRFRGLSIGGQLELPFGDRHHGLAAEHMETLPYAAWHGEWRRGFPASTRLGFRTSLSQAHGHGAGTPLLVNAHEDKELAYRAGIAPFPISMKWASEIFLDGQHAFSGEIAGTGFLTAGFVIRTPLTGRLTLGFLFETPLTSPERLRSRAGLNLAFRL